MNSTLVDNATLDFLTESTKAHINARLMRLQFINDTTWFKSEVDTLKTEIKLLSKIDSQFVRRCEISIGAIEIISNNEL